VGVDGAAADDGHYDGGFGVLRGRNFGQVVGEDDEVGEFASFQFALFAFHEFGVSGAGGVRTDAIVEGDFFLWLPAARGAAVGKFARDASVEAAEGAYHFDVIVGAEGEARA